MKYLHLLVIALLVAASAWALSTEFNHPAIISFEANTAPASADINSQLSIGNNHYKHLANSLCWKWNTPGAQWFIKQPIDYVVHDVNSKDNKVSTFVFWIYSTKLRPNEKLKFEFLKNGKVCTTFEYGLNFTGWRSSWLVFDRDMQGKPEVGMDEMRVTAPQEKSGELYFDHLILSTGEDIRMHFADFQAPYINKNVKNSWMDLLNTWDSQFDLPQPTTISESELSSMKEIYNRFEKKYERSKPLPLEVLTASFNKYSIVKNSDGTLKGLPIFLEKYGQIYLGLGGPTDYSKVYPGESALINANKLLLNLAVAYNKSIDKVQKDSIGNMFVTFMTHYLDQGFQYGSAMGTLDNMGYHMRDYFPAALLMKEPLKRAGIYNQVQLAMEWFAGTRELKTAPIELGMNIDLFNTFTLSRLTSILMLDDSPVKSQYLTAFSRWINNGLLFSNGTVDGFKIDGCIYHHKNNYPAYATGGLSGAIMIIEMLTNTSYDISANARTNLKNSLLAMRTYCNLRTWPLSLSARHPNGLGSLDPEQYGRMALTGTPNYDKTIDPELGAAYLQLTTNTTSPIAKQIIAAGIKAENAPSGNWSYNYSCLSVHRRDNWLVTAVGHSRYLWGSEIYQGANMFGRYVNFGSLQLLTSGNPISNYGSGYKQIGWDWNHFPGTTAAVVPLKYLRANVVSLNSTSGFEEELLSDESFAGSISLKNKQGAFGMKLHEHDKYNGSLRARKSYFFFDNRVVALGTNICSALQGKEVHTTLFQVHIPDSTKAIEVNNKSITEFPYSQTLNGKSNVLSDGLNNYFFVKNGNVMVQKALQNSLDHNTEKPTSGNFALAAINSGVAPTNGSYEYMVLVQPNQKEVDETKKNAEETQNPLYKVLQQDSLAHIVYDKATQSTGYVLFEAGKLKVNSLILSVSLPCMIMTSTATKDMIAISVCDPDLHLYEGKSDDIYDTNGKRMEQSVFSRKWSSNPSAESVIEVRLKGNWETISQSDFIQVKKIEKGVTVYLVKCQHGLSREMNLKRLK